MSDTTEHYEIKNRAKSVWAASIPPNTGEGRALTKELLDSFFDHLSSEPERPKFITLVTPNVYGWLVGQQAQGVDISRYRSLLDLTSEQRISLSESLKVGLCD